MTTISEQVAVLHTSISNLLSIRLQELVVMQTASGPDGGDFASAQILEPGLTGSCPDNALHEDLGISIEILLYGSPHIK